MQGTRHFLEVVRDRDLVPGFLRGVFHIAIGRRLLDPTGRVIAEGITWRELAGLLKELKYDRDLVRELGADPETLSPKDRERFWYNAIAAAKVDGDEARLQADDLATRLRVFGLLVGPAPGKGTPKPPPAPAEPPDLTQTPEHGAPSKKRKKT